MEVAMFSIGDRVMHPGQGLCTVVDLEGDPVQTLVLECGSGRKATYLRFPVSQVEGHLRAPVCREQALAVIDGYAAMACDPHRDRNSGQEEAYFKAKIKAGVPDSVCVVKTMRARIHEAEARRVKPSAYLTRLLKEARLRSLEELACALDSTPEAVEALFLAQEAPAQ